MKTKSYLHPSEQKGWRKNESSIGRTRGQLSDQEYFASVGINNPLIRYIITRYSQYERKTGEGSYVNEAKVNIIGYPSVAIGIELSQWDYPIIFTADNEEDIIKAKRDCEIQAGVFKHFVKIDNLYEIPSAVIIAFIGILDEGIYRSDTEAKRFIQLIKSKCFEMTFVVSTNRDWRTLLEELKEEDDNIEYYVQHYPDKPLLLITIRS